jgi:transcriptional regulator with XRE-family HTH domain
MRKRTSTKRPRRETGRILRRMATNRPRGKGSTFGEEFGARLRAARDRRGMTQAQLAEVTGAYPSQISNYENGEKIPEGETMVALADALDVSLDELARGTPREEPDEVRDVRLRASVRELEELHDRRLIDVAVTVIDGLVVHAHQSALHERVSQRRKR